MPDQPEWSPREDPNGIFRVKIYETVCSPSGDPMYQVPRIVRVNLQERLRLLRYRLKRFPF